MTRDPQRLDIYCMDVGQGDLTIVVPPDGEGDPIVFDCADDYVARRFLDAHKFTQIEAVVVSHLDVDHIRGVFPLMKNWFDAGNAVGRLFLGRDRDGLSGEGAALVDAALDWHRDKCVELRPPFTQDGESQLVASGHDWRVELVLPLYVDTLEAGLRSGKSNQCSVVLRVTRGDKIVYIGGDATLGAWERLHLASPIDANAMRTPHHGGEMREGGAAWTEFTHLYDASKPTATVVSVGTRNAYKHPLPEHISAMSRAGACHVFCTQLTPQCHSATNLPSLREAAITNATNVEYPYRHRAKPGDPKDPSHRGRSEVPCAGTVLIGLPETGDIVYRPAKHAHRRFVSGLFNPLCRR